MKNAYNSLNLQDRKRLQKILIEYGYNSKIDGIWGSGTKKSLKKFVADSIGKEIFDKITVNEFKKYLLNEIKIIKNI